MAFWFVFEAGPRDLGREGWLDQERPWKKSLTQDARASGAAEIAERDQDHVPEVKVLTTLGRGTHSTGDGV